MQRPTDTHPLLPGVRSPEVNSRDWPRTLHDRQLTGFSPLTLGMSGAPRVWQTIELPGEYQWVESVDAPAGPAFLVDDGRLRLFGTDGACRWQAAASGHLVFWGDLFGDGTPVALVRAGNRLTVVDGATGQVRWTRAWEPPHVDLRVAVEDVLPGPGLQAAVFEQYGEGGALLTFEPDGTVREVWYRVVLSDDVWPARADHGCDVAFDLEAARPRLWNVRHHRCQSFDAVSGERLGTLEYKLGGDIRRNYGPWRIATGAEGQRVIVVASEMVQTHVHGLRLHDDGTPELAWQRYYGEVYVVPGVAVEFLGVLDLDGDGEDEILYNVRDPEHDFRAFVRARDVVTGEVKHEWADRWCSALATEVATAGRDVLYLHPAPDGATPEQGPLQLVTVADGSPQVLAAFDHGGPWGIPTVPGTTGADLLLRLVVDGEADSDTDGEAEKTARAAIVRLDGDSLSETGRAEAGPLLAAPVAAIAREAPATACPAPGTEQDRLPPRRASASDGYPHGLVLASSVGLFAWPAGAPDDGAGAVVPLDLRGGAPPTLSAADTHGEGAARIYAHVPGHRLRAWRFIGDTAEPTLDEGFLGDTARHAPLLYDLDGDGALELVLPGADARGRLQVRALRPDGTDLWRSLLPGARTDDAGKASAWNAGAFLVTPDAGDGDGHAIRAGLALSVYSHRRTLEGTYMLDGPSGRVLWFQDLYREGDTIRGVRPVGLPGAFDWDGDGVEEIAWDLYSYMAFHRGDGSIAAIFGGPNVRPESEAVPAISLYNGFSPIWRHPEDERPHWLVHHGHGRFGVVGPDPRQGLWYEDVGYDTPDRIGFIDVDGDGVLEVGYALRNSVEFRCRDLWTGEDRWTVELPAAPSGPVLTADVDGDGKGEFLVDRWCIGTDNAGQGQIRWTSPAPLGWAAIADVDGDGLGEILCAGRGQITVLKGRG